MWNPRPEKLLQQRRRKMARLELLLAIDAFSFLISSDLPLNS